MMLVELRTVETVDRIRIGLCLWSLGTGQLTAEHVSGAGAENGTE